MIVYEYRLIYHETTIYKQIDFLKYGKFECHSRYTF